MRTASRSKPRSRAARFSSSSRGQPALDLAAHRLEGRRRNDAFGGAAHPHQQIDAGVGPRGGDGAGHVAVGDEPDPRPGAPHLGDQLLVTGTVQDDDGQIADRRALGLGHGVEVVADGPGDVDGPDGPRADGQLLHVDARARIEHRALLGHGDHRQRPTPAQRGRRGAVDRVHGDVGLGRTAVADPLAVEEHRGVVLLTLADHHHAVHGDRRQDHPHGVDGGAVGSVLVAPAHPPRCGQRRGLGDADEFHGQIAVWCLRSGVHALRRYFLAPGPPDPGAPVPAPVGRWARPESVTRARGPAGARRPGGSGPGAPEASYWCGGPHRRHPRRAAVGHRPGRGRQELRPQADGRLPVGRGRPRPDQRAPHLGRRHHGRGARVHGGDGDPRRATRRAGGVHTARSWSPRPPTNWWRRCGRRWWSSGPC